MRAFRRKSDHAWNEISEIYRSAFAAKCRSFLKKNTYIFAPLCQIRKKMRFAEQFGTNLLRCTVSEKASMYAQEWNILTFQSLEDEVKMTRQANKMNADWNERVDSLLAHVAYVTFWDTKWQQAEKAKTAWR